MKKSDIKQVYYTHQLIFLNIKLENGLLNAILLVSKHALNFTNLDICNMCGSHFVKEYVTDLLRIQASNLMLYNAFYKN